MSSIKYGYHVTFRSSVSSIMEKGLLMSEDGSEGPGVYLWIESSTAENPRFRFLQGVMDHIYDYLLDGIEQEYPEDVTSAPEKYFALLEVKLEDNPACEGMRVCDDMVILEHPVDPKFISEVHGWDEEHTNLFSQG